MHNSQRIFVKVLKLDTPYASGDWHDSLLKWRAVGPAGERQDFSTKKDATRYARIRRTAKDSASAESEYVKGYKA